MNTLLAYTIATKPYDFYVAPFCAAVACMQPSSRVEVLVDRERLDALRDQLSVEIQERTLLRPIPDRFDAWRKVPEESRVCKYGSRHPAGSIRWLVKPLTAATYVYTCDCDLLLTNSYLVPRQLEIMAKLHTCYANIVRQVSEHGDQQRMTGCHFAKQSEFYNGIPDGFLSNLAMQIDNGDFRYYDERLLYHIVKHTHGLPPEWSRGRYGLRPLFGLHVSSTRRPTDSLGWNINALTVTQYRALQQHRLWRETERHFDERYRRLLGQLEGAISED